MHGQSCLHLVSREQDEHFKKGTNRRHIRYIINPSETIE